MKRINCVILPLMAIAIWTAPIAHGADAGQIIKGSGATGRIIVHVGCGDGAFTAALGSEGEYLVRGLDTEAGNIEAARRHIKSKGLYGRVSVGRFDGKTLPYVDNLLNLIVSEKLGDVSMKEVLRALAPLGAAYIKQGDKWVRTVKPWPKEIDEWPQYLHGPDNNAVARDTVAGPPRHLRWVAGPGWGRSHMAISTVISMVSAKGRLFTIEDRATVENPFLPARFALVARDAFNGIVLWRHDFTNFEPVTRYIKDIAVQLQRRVAAIGDTVYCTPGLNAPLAAFDGATGKIIRKYPDTARTQEFAYDRGVLYLVIGDRMNAARYNIVKTYSGKGKSLGGSDPKAPFDGTGFRGAYGPETPDKDNPICDIVAIRADSGRQLWRTGGIAKYVGCTLAIRGPYAVYQSAGGIVCLNPTTGAKIWSVDKRIPSGDGTEANTLILSDDSVYAQEGGSLAAYSLKDGSPKWRGPIAANYEKSADLFLAAGAIWTGGSRQPTSFDPKSGQKIITIKQGMNGPMSHDRCYRNFITERFYINSKTGGADFLTLDGKAEFPHQWVRGTCGTPPLPCNGMLYSSPYSCQCSIGPMINNINALYTAEGLKSSGQMIGVERKVRLVKGAAYGKVQVSEAKSEDWPTYRCDAARGGVTKSKVPAKLTPLWKAKVRTVGSAPVVAGGKVFVADIDAHTVYAFNVSDGATAWSYVAGGRVDSPPTCHKGLVIFGSRDGWVHCLRASDGALVWRFKDLPDKTVCAFGQLESAWPVSGSVLVAKTIVYFAAGRSSFLDGGIFLYGLNPQTGKVICSRQVYGPFDKATGFPAVANRGSKSDILVTDGKMLYMRHKAFNADLSDAKTPGAHLIPSAGFLDGVPQHRTYWTVSAGFGGKTAVNSPHSDILVTSGKEFYGVEGFPVQRHSYFDPRVKGYKLLAGSINVAGPVKKAPAAKGAPKGRRRGKQGPGSRTKASEKWSTHIPLTGKAMVLAGDVVFIAGEPMFFPPNHPVAKYQAAYQGKLGGVLWAASAVDGAKLAEYKLDSAPAWDGMAAAGGRIYVSLKNGQILCLGGKAER